MDRGVSMGRKGARAAATRADLRARELESLESISAAIARAGDVESVARVLLDEIAALIGVEFVGLALVDENMNEARGLLARREGRIQEAAEILRTRVKVQRIFAAIVRLDAGEPIARLAAEFRTPPELPNRGSRNSDRMWLTFHGRLALKRGEATKALELLQSALDEPAHHDRNRALVRLRPLGHLGH